MFVRFSPLCFVASLFKVQFLEDESEANLHSFQGNEAGQDMDYEPGLEFDDSDLGKGTESEYFFQQTNASYLTMATGMTNIDSDADCSIILDDNPLFSLDSQYHGSEDVDDDEKTTVEILPKNNRCSHDNTTAAATNNNNNNNHNNNNNNPIHNKNNIATVVATTTDGSLTEATSKTKVDNITGLNGAGATDAAIIMSRPTSLLTQTNLESRLPQPLQTQQTNQQQQQQHYEVNQQQHHSHHQQTNNQNSSTTPFGIDVSSIYLQSPDELLEENFEEALREQCASFPPLDPALDLTHVVDPTDPEQENFNDIAQHGIVGVAGVDDNCSRKVITIYACRLPSNKEFNYTKFLR